MDQTTLNLKFLTALNACDAAKDFIKRNNLEAFPVSMLDQIQGDYDGWVKWIRNTLNTSQLEFNTNGNIIYYKNSNGYEYWQEFDSNNNMIHYKNSIGCEQHYPTEYYSNGQLKRYGDMILPNLSP